MMRSSGRVAESGEGGNRANPKLRITWISIPSSFDFQLGSKIYNSENALTGLEGL